MMRRAAPILVPLALAACDAPKAQPMAMPPVTGASYPLTLDTVDYVVTRVALDSAPKGEVLRVYRADPPGFDYSEGLAAKTAAVAFCAQWNRGLDPQALGYFEPLGAWAFPGGCA